MYHLSTSNPPHKDLSHGNKQNHFDAEIYKSVEYSNICSSQRAIQISTRERVIISRRVHATEEDVAIKRVDSPEWISTGALLAGKIEKYT